MSPFRGVGCGPGVRVQLSARDVAVEDVELDWEQDCDHGEAQSEEADEAGLVQLRIFRGNYGGEVFAIFANAIYDND